MDYYFKQEMDYLYVILPVSAIITFLSYILVNK
jgi:hypothetical protein